MMTRWSWGEYPIDINPDGFSICAVHSIYLRFDMCLTARDYKDLYHIELSKAKYIEFCKTKYIEQACLYIDIKVLSDRHLVSGDWHPASGIWYLATGDWRLTH